MKHTMRKHQGKIQSDITSLHEDILDIIVKIDLMVFVSLLMIWLSLLENFLKNYINFHYF